MKVFTRALGARFGLCAAGLLLTSGCGLDFEEFRGAGPADAVVTVPDVGFPDADPGADGAVMGDMGPMPDMAMVQPDMGPLDMDMDGVLDDQDNCPEVANPDQSDIDEDLIGDLCDPDRDGDGIEDPLDNCPAVANPGQTDMDRDDQGDACDPDADGDGLVNNQEEVLGTNPLRQDSDGDGFNDPDDLCPVAPDRVGGDGDMDRFGDACDQDDDNDGVADWLDNCPGAANPDQAAAEPGGRGDACADDADSDGVVDEMDNCPYLPNPDQMVQPCSPRISPLTFARTVYDVTVSGETVYAATSGGEARIAVEIEMPEEGPDFEVVRSTFRTTGDLLPGNIVRAVKRDATGRRWVVTDGGLAIIRPDGFTFAVRPSDPEGGPVGQLRDVAVTGEGEVIWVSSDEGLFRWTQMAGWRSVMLPTPDVRRLYVDSMDRLWAAHSGGVARIAGPDAAPDMLQFAPLGPGFYGVVGEGPDAWWVLAENGAARIDANDVIVPGGLYQGFEARDLSGAPDGARYLATEAGVRRIDAAGRLFPAGGRILPGSTEMLPPDVRTLATSEAGLRWVGTDQGLVGLDGHFAPYLSGPDGNGLDNPCVTASYRAGDLIWAGTDNGLYTLNVEGEFTQVAAGDLPGPNIYAIQRVGDEIWVGTDAGIGRFDLDGVSVGQLVEADGIPAGGITQIEALGNGEIWVGSSQSGVARGVPAGEAIGWTPYTFEVNPQLLSDAITGLAWTQRTSTVWIATTAGLARFSTEANAFQAPVAQVAGLTLSDVVVDAGGYAYVGTAPPPGEDVGAQGVYAETPGGAWVALRRASMAWPSFTTSDHVLDLAFDGRYLWVMLDPGRSTRGGWLVRLSTPVEGNNLPVGTLYDTLSADLPATVGRSAVYSEGELHLAFCGDIARPGGFVVVDGGGIIDQDATETLGVAGGAGDRSLTIDETGAPLYVTETPNGLRAWRLLSESPYSEPYPLNATLSNALPSKCRLPTDGTPNLWCVLKGLGAGRRLPDNGSWSISNVQGATVQAVAPLAERTVWIGTDTGIQLFNPPEAIVDFNRARTGGGIPNDDIRAMVAGTDGTVYAGTAAGLGRWTPEGGGGVSDGTWSAIGLEQDFPPTAEVTDLALEDTGELWIGTTDGLFRFVPALNRVAPFDLSNGLPSTRIRGLDIGPGGTVLVSTEAGLSIGTNDGANWRFETLSVADGLPGTSGYEVVYGDGAVWVRSNNGLGRVR